MAKINSDKHGIYFIYNGSVWRPIIPEKEKSIAEARRIVPDNSELLIGETAKHKGIEGFFIHVVINGMDYLWYNHGTKRIGFQSESVYRNFVQEDVKINSLIASGLSIKEAYSIFWKTLI